MNEKKFLLKVLLIGAVMLVINTYFYQICFVNGDSMKPTLNNGDIVIIKKYNLSLDNGDIVVAKKNGNIIIKRIAGIQNDSVKIGDFETKLKENEYFLVGDNSEHSIDSRHEEIGVIKREEIIGKVILNRGKVK